MDVHLIVQIIALFFTVIGAIWVYEKSVKERFDKMWSRMDEKQKNYFDIFIKKEIYENDQRHIKEMSEEQRAHTMQFFSDKFKSLEDKFDELKQAFKDNNKNNHQSK